MKGERERERERETKKIKYILIKKDKVTKKLNRRDQFNSIHNEN
jgi:hypothetical protein